MDEDQYRRMVGIQAAHTILIGFLLRALFKDLGEDGIDQVAGSLREMVRTTDHFAGVTKGDETKSERLADTVIQMQEHAVKVIDNAAAAAKELARHNRAQGR